MRGGDPGGTVKLSHGVFGWRRWVMYLTTGCGFWSHLMAACRMQLCNTKTGWGNPDDGLFCAVPDGFGHQAYKQKHGAAPPNLKSNTRRQISSDSSAGD